jgi:hypothetical protein
MEMSKIPLALVGVVVVGSAMLTPSLVVRAQSASRIEYVRVTPYAAYTPVSPNAVREHYGYRACVAGLNEWACREFRAESSTDALRTALVTLGNEGWELVSTVEENPNVSGTVGVTYLFKRRVR